MRYQIGGLGWAIAQGTAIAFGLAIGLADAGAAQIVPDGTLGTEGSRVTPNVLIRGGAADRIEGGAVRGANLFHSFQEFNIGNGQRVYFANPADVRNILTRVTGNNLSNIQGTLGVEGSANLFLMNPNGLVFGQNARLDVGGSFVGTTANAIGFGNQGFFSATNPEAPPLLTISPSALLFSSQLGTPSRILVQGDGQGIRTSTTLIDTQAGLRVPGDHTLALIGGDLVFEGATLKTAGGRIELGSVGTSSTVELKPVATGWSFDYANVQNFRDIQLFQQSAVDASGLGGGNIQVQGRQITLTDGSQIEASTLGSLPGGGLAVTASNSIDLISSATDRFYTGLFAQVYQGATGAGGNINVISGRFNLAGNYATATTSTYGSGRGGNLTIYADVVEVAGSDQSSSLTRLEADAAGRAGGQGGDLTIDARQLWVRNAQVSASTTGTGQAGNLTVRATDSVELNGEILDSRNGAPGGLFAIVNPGATGQGGNLVINTGRLSISDGSKAQAISFGNGDAGNVLITADRIEVFETNRANTYSTGIFAGTGVDPNNIELPRGNGGSVTIRANQVSIRGGKISADVSGQGNAGRALIQARDSVEVVDTLTQTGASSSITANVNPGATGRGGDLTIETRNLTVLGSQISASTSGTGDSGNLTIQADSVKLSGESSDAGDGSGYPGGLFAQVNRTGVGHGGRLNIRTNYLSISDGSKVQVATFGQGNAGDLFISANAIDVLDTQRYNYYSTSISADVSTDASVNNRPVGTGDGGNVTIETGRLSINGGQVTADTDGQGNAGTLRIHARDLIEIGRASADGSRGFLTADVNRGARGRGGSLIIETGDLIVRDNGRVSTNTYGRGNAGNLTITARNVNIEGSQISSSTFATGNAGNLNIQASNSIVLNREIPGTNGDNGSPGGLFAQVNRTGVGHGGDLSIQTNYLSISDGSKVQVATFGQGNAGDLFISANAIDVLDTQRYNYYSTGIFADVSTDASVDNRPVGTGNGGNVTIETGRLSIHGGQVTADTDGKGNAGTLRIHARDLIEIGNTSVSGSQSFLTADVNKGARGQGGSLIINTRQLMIRNGGIVGAATFGTGNAGTVQVNATDSIEIEGSSTETQQSSSLRALVAAGATGNGGDLIITTNRLRLTNRGQILASTSGQGNAGSISIRRADSIALDNGSISTVVNGGAVAQKPSNIDIQTRSLTLTNGAQITASSFGQGNAGDITMTANSLEASRGGQIRTSTATDSRAGNITLSNLDQVMLSGTDSGLFASTDRTSTGQAGDINISTRQLNIQDNAKVAIDSQGTGRAGNLDITARNVSLDRGTITANTASSQGGDIGLNISNSLQLHNNSEISASTQNGQGGNLTLNADRNPANTVQLRNGSRLSVEATGAGSAGNVDLNAREITIQDRATTQARAATPIQERGGIFASNMSDRSPQGRGNITLRGLNSLQVSNGEISASTATGRAGSLSIPSSNSVRLNNSRLAVAASEGGIAGTLNINTGQLTLQNGSQVTVSSNRAGRAGNLNVTVRDISLDGRRTELTATTESGDGANIEINALNSLRLTNNSAISASTQNGQGGRLRINANRAPTNAVVVQDDSRITTSARNSGDAGSLRINTRQLTVNNGSISASANSGQSGSLNINAVESVALSGRGGLSVAATDRRGRAGNLTVTTHQFKAEEAASATVSNPQGQAGNLTINANDIQLGRDSSLTAQTGGNPKGRDRQEGAVIRLQGVDQLFMQNGSQISAQAFDQANGGNVTIRADNGFVVARVGANQNNDIIASAKDGDGGNIGITTQGIFGIEERRQSPLTNDIDASSDFGLNGNIDINQLSTDPSRGLIELPTVPTDAAQQIAAACPTSAEEADRLGSFIVSGRGGLPPSPIDLLNEDNTVTPWVTAAESSNTQAEVPPSASTPPIVEAQNWVVNAQGKVILVAPSALSVSPIAPCP